ncbi:MAG: hypothetical protein H7256_14695 [Bdellovibrio sp.]|nr:hypothetical protein [Bdellovibrio sp.]
MKVYPSHSNLFHGVDMAAADIDSRVEICDASSLVQDDLSAKDPQLSILASEDFEPSQVVGMMAKNKFRSFVQKRDSHFVNDLNVSSQILIDPNLYFAQGGRGSLPEVHREFEFKFRSASDKPELKKSIEQFVSQIGSDNVSESVEAILEELYMNAMFDAPKEAVNRGQVNCKYEDGQYAVIRIFQNESRLAVVCEDPFGSLNLTKLMNRMDEVYQKGAGSAIRLDDDANGAGLGCVMMFEHCESLFLGVMPGQRTLVTCLIPLGISNRKRSQIKKSLHLIHM